MPSFALASLGGLAGVVSLAAFARGRPYAVFAAVILGVHTAISVALLPLLGPLGPALWFLQAGVFLHFAALARPAMRSLPWRVLVSVPASFFAAGTFLALPWAIPAAFGLALPGVFVPYALALIGVFQSFTARRETHDLALDGADAGVDVVPHPEGVAREERPLRIVQITDPHLGPFMSVERLAQICQRAVDADPDLVLLTGDFLTMESQGTSDALARALAPLRSVEGRTFACMGNHDHEAPRIVLDAMRANGVRMLIDEAALVETVAGPVQIVGADHRWRDRDAHLRALVARWPRVEGALRLVLLHDPSSFAHLPAGEGDLVLSGHTHGGQVGLVSLGMSWTAIRSLWPIPDHGFWARGTDRLYVHRGTGHYGFPLRLGVPAEESVVRVHRVGR